MDVEVVQWPHEEKRLAQLRQSGHPRLLLVQSEVSAPVTADALEDWVRVPASQEDIDARLRVLAERGTEAGWMSVSAPEIDDDGVLRVGASWVSLPPVEERLTQAMLDRYRAVVSRDALARAGWPDGMPGRNVLDVHIVRLRRRLAPLNLAIRTVRSRGYLLEPSN